jgi:hypothetical protein
MCKPVSSWTQQHCHHFVQMMTQALLRKYADFSPLRPPFFSYPFHLFNLCAWFPLVFCGFISTAPWLRHIRFVGTSDSPLLQSARTSHPLERHLNLWAAALASSGVTWH